MLSETKNKDTLLILFFVFWVLWVIRVIDSSLHLTKSPYLITNNCDLTPNFKERHGHFLKSTCDMSLIDMGKNISDVILNRHVTTRLCKNQHGNSKYSNRGHFHILNLIWDIGDPPSRAPITYVPWCLLKRKSLLRILIYIQFRGKWKRKFWI